MQNDYLKSVRMSEVNQRALLEQMDSAMRPVEESQRAEDRASWRLLDVPVEVTHPDGARARFLVCMRNISCGGASFIHGGFLYPGSKLVVLLPTIWGDFESLEGVITNCRHVEGQNHEIGVRFIEPFDRRRCLTLPGETPLDPDPDTSERNELVGRLLYVDQSPADAKLVAFHLKDSRITIESAMACEEAVEKIKSMAVDLILLSHSIDGVGDQSAVECLRSAGFKGPVVLVNNSAETSKQGPGADSGGLATLTKPYSPARLIAVLSGCLASIETSGDGPIYSELSSNPDAVELVEYYLGFVEETAGRLRDSIEKDEYEPALEACRSLMETGAGYGFTPISTSAKVAVTELTASMSINESITEVQRLLGVCARIEARGAPDGKERK